MKASPRIGFSKSANQALLSALSDLVSLTTDFTVHSLQRHDSSLGSLRDTRKQLEKMKIMWLANLEKIPHQLQRYRDALTQHRLRDARDLLVRAGEIQQHLNSLKAIVSASELALVDELVLLWDRTCEVLDTISASAGAGVNPEIAQLRDQILIAKEARFRDFTGKHRPLALLDGLDRIRFGNDDSRPEILDSWATFIATTWKIRDPTLRDALARRQEEAGLSRGDIKRQVAVEGILLALTQFDHLHRIRMGQEWVNRPSHQGKRVCRLRPSEELNPEELLTWFKNEAIRAAEAILLDETYPAGRSRSPRGLDVLELRDDLAKSPDRLIVPTEGSDNRTAFAIDDPSPLDALIAAEAPEQARRDVQDIMAMATPGERRVLEALRAAYDQTSDRAKAEKIAAKSLGIATSTVRQQLFKVRHKSP